MEVELPESLRNMARERIYIYTGSVRPIEMLSQPLLLSVGAEAYILRARFMGVESIIKWRFPKPYMPPEFDREFRRFRTEIEARIMWRVLSIGVKAPIPLYTDVDDAFIIMTYIEGVVLRELVNMVGDGDLCRVCRELGVYAAKMHGSGISHGDLTTSNVIVDPEGTVHLIDFGLASFGKRDEDYAIDLHIFFRSVESAHIAHQGVMRSCFLEGYRTVAGADRTAEMLRVVDSIRRRGRYIAERRLRSEWRSV